MNDKKPCLRCERAIDPYAKLCPYCNWDQSDPNPPRMEPASATSTYVPPKERDWRRFAMMAGGFLLLLVASFGIGAWINSDGAPKNVPEAVTGDQPAAAPVGQARRSDVTLVPMGAGEMEQPITSAPAGQVTEGVPPEYQRSDATAVSSVEYAQLAERAKAERAAPKMVDPRTLRGPAYAQAPERPRSMTSSSEDGAPAREVTSSRPTTYPVPEYQPLPRITVSQPVTARLVLMIDAEGRVSEVNLRSSIPGQTPKLIAAVQSWRFKPATRNGQPVAAPFTVDISFKP